MIIPIVGKCMFVCVERWKNRNDGQARQRNTTLALSCIRITYRWMTGFNAYRKTDADESVLRQQKCHTRIYLMLYGGALSVLLLYTSFIERSLTKVVQQPSIAAYERLSVLYPSNVNCPCTYSSIAYDQFITSRMITNRSLTRIQFHDEVEKTLNLSRASIYGNAFIAARSTNWQFVISGTTKDERATFHSEASCI
jgi:hypothetical protein